MMLLVIWYATKLELFSIFLITNQQEAGDLSSQPKMFVR